MSADKDQLIVSMFEELKKLREQNEKLMARVEELSKIPTPVISPVSLSQLQDQLKKSQELSDSTRDTLGKTVEIILRYAKATQFC